MRVFLVGILSLVGGLATAMPAPQYECVFSRSEKKANEHWEEVESKSIQLVPDPTQSQYLKMQLGEFTGAVHTQPGNPTRYLHLAIEKSDQHRFVGSVGVHPTPWLFIYYTQSHSEHRLSCKLIN